MNHFVKEPATIEAQLSKLEHRGCIIEDRHYAREILGKINYYRLVRYFNIFRTHTQRESFKNRTIPKYHEGTTFNKVVRLYDFDRRLRGQLLIFLEEIEISLRAVISNYHALKYGALGYLNEGTLNHSQRNAHARFLSRIERLIENNHDLGFVSHHKNKYAGTFPLWVIMELFSFGMLAHFYADLHKQDKKEIAAKHFGDLSERHIEAWLESIAELRNHCAHYCRIYANRIDPAPRPLETAPFKMDNNLFSFIYVMKRLNKEPYFGSEQLLPQLSALMEEYADVIELGVLGFPENWEEILI